MLRFAVLMLAMTCIVQAQSTAEKMALLSDLGWLDTGEEATKRYEYILPKLRVACSDASTDVRVADMLVVGHRFVKDAGAAKDENLLKYTENAYQVVRNVERSYRTAKIPMKCAEVFSFYAVARREGKPPTEAIKLVSNGVVAFLNLAGGAEE